MPITIQQNIDIEITPEQLAAIFCEMDDVEQSRFFNHMGKETTTWKVPFEFQLAAIQSCERLDEGGKRVLTTMAEFFQRIDPTLLIAACQTVVNTYTGDGFEGMRERDIVFNETCKTALAKMTNQW